MSRHFFLLVCIAVGSISSTFAQDPASWKYSVEKKDGRTYELHLTATVQSPWHIYSQTQPEDAIPMPTVVKFIKNPMLIMAGKTKEVGKKEMHKDPTLGSTDYRYSGTLDLVQTVTVRGSTKTNLSGSITYQLCTDERCLAPKTVNFNLKLE